MSGEKVLHVNVDGLSDGLVRSILEGEVVARALEIANEAFKNIENGVKSNFIVKGLLDIPMDEDMPVGGVSSQSGLDGIHPNASISHDLGYILAQIRGGIYDNGSKVEEKRKEGLKGVARQILKTAFEEFIARIKEYEEKRNFYAILDDDMKLVRGDILVFRKDRV